MSGADTLKRAVGFAVAITAVVAAEASAQPESPPAPYPYPPPVVVPPPPPLFILPRFYIRGDAGGAFSETSRFRDTDFATRTLGRGVRLRGNSGNSPIYDAGIGARFLPYLRVDVTGSYVPSLHFSGGDNIGLGTANTAQIHSWVGLVNAYFDFPVLTIFGPLEPYVDFGIGAARNHIGAMTSGFIGGSFAGHATTSVAGSVGAGLGIPLARNVTLDLAYKFIDLGEVRTGAVQTATVAGVGTAIALEQAAARTVTLVAAATAGLKTSALACL